MVDMDDDFVTEGLVVFTSVLDELVVSTLYCIDTVLLTAIVDAVATSPK